MSQRPDIQTITSAAAFRDWYWLKAELIAHCKLLGIPYNGNKAELTDRIAIAIETGDLRKVPKPKRRKAISKFNWKTEKLTLDTVVTDSYKNNENMRRFMQTHADPKFKFYIDFMRWMKDNGGKTLREAVEAHQTFMLRKQDPNFKSTIPPSNQYNRYLRDFFNANPDLTIGDARKCWLWTRNQAGTNVYVEDLPFRRYLKQIVEHRLELESKSSKQ
ncbi:MAG: DUF6434 domain-containing protein [Saprospiraceae bacterium]